MILIVPIAEVHIAGFRECLDIVAREKRFLALIEAPPLEQVRSFVRTNIANDVVQFVALDDGRVIGWADIFAAWQPALAHCGNLGIGVLPAHRGRGIGGELLRACLAKARQKGITRVELEARVDNADALRLYEKHGFVREGVKRNGMRFDGKYFDTVLMSCLQMSP
jgi:RimJ/RimL family protein N-acetyltransferase